MNVNVWSFGGEHPRRRFIIWPAGASSAFPQHVQNDSQGRRIGTGCDSEAVARHQNKFQSHTRAAPFALASTSANRTGSSAASRFRQ